MAYTIVEFRGNHYIKADAGDKPPPNIGPYRHETDARRALDQLNQLNSEQNERPRKETVQP